MWTWRSHSVVIVIQTHPEPGTALNVFYPRVFVWASRAPRAAETCPAALPAAGGRGSAPSEVATDIPRVAKKGAEEREISPFLSNPDFSH